MEIKKFKQFIKESVLMPDELEKVQFRDYDQLKQYCDDNNIDLVNYQEFYDSLSEKDKETAPPDEPQVPFFALYHRERNKPMFVLKDNRIVQAPFFSQAFFEIIGHEMVHAKQQSKRELKFTLPDPKIKKSYFSDKDEIMAFSWTIADHLHNTNSTFDEAINKLRKGISPNSFHMSPPPEKMWIEIRQNVDNSVLKKYNKYIYQYLRKMYKVDKEEESSIEDYGNFLNNLKNITN